MHNGKFHRAFGIAEHDYFLIDYIPQFSELGKRASCNQQLMKIYLMRKSVREIIDNLIGYSEYFQFSFILDFKLQ